MPGKQIPKRATTNHLHVVSWIFFYNMQHSKHNWTLLFCEMFTSSCLSTYIQSAYFIDSLILATVILPESNLASSVQLVRDQVFSTNPQGSIPLSNMSYQGFRWVQPCTWMHPWASPWNSFWVGVVLRQPWQLGRPLGQGRRSLVRATTIHPERQGQQD